MKKQYGVGVVFLLILLTACSSNDGKSNDPVNPPAQPGDTVQPGTPPSLDKTELTFTAGAYGPIPDRQWIYYQSSANFIIPKRLNDTSRRWLTLARGTDGTIDFEIKTTELDVGLYTANIRLNYYLTDPVGGQFLGYKDVTISLNILDRISIETTALQFNTFDKSVLTPQANVALQAGNINWQVSTADPWLQVSPVNGNGTAMLSVTAPRVGSVVAAGQYASSFTVTDMDSNELFTVPINVSIEPYRLSVDRRGVALSSFNTSTQITVSDNASVNEPWIASTSAAWLTLSTMTGVTGDSITLSANTARLSEGIYKAAIVIKSTGDATVSNEVNITVGLYVSNTPLSAMPSTADYTVSDYSVYYMDTDPIRPYVYFQDRLKKLFVSKNMYTGLTENEYAYGAMFTGVGDILVDHRGEFLYFVSRNLEISTPIRYMLRRLNADTFKLENWSVDLGNPTGGAYYNIRSYFVSNGRELILSSAGEVIDIADAAIIHKISSIPSFSQVSTAVLDTENRLYFGAIGSVNLISGIYSYLPDSVFELTLQTSASFSSSKVYNLFSNPRFETICAIVVYEDGVSCFNSNLDVASKRLLPIGVIRTATLTRSGFVYAVSYADNGAFAKTAFELGKYTSDGARVNVIALGTDSYNKLYVSSDGVRMIAFQGGVSATQFSLYNVD